MIIEGKGKNPLIWRIFNQIALFYMRHCSKIWASERDAVHLPKGGVSVTVEEVIALLNLLAVVIFGVLNLTKKK
jgi:hypothetical protein